MPIEIREVKTRAELIQFIKYPFALYKGQPNWIPPLIRSEIAALSPDKNPVFEHSEAVKYTAWKDGKMVGRIVGMINHLEEEHIHEKHARFGWIDFIDDKNVSKALINAVGKWAKEKGSTILKGPYGFNQLGKNGMLTEGFDSISTVNTIYNYEYYPAHIKALGFEIDLEWVELLFTLPPTPPERYIRFTEIAKKRYKLKTIKPKNNKEMIKMGHQFFDLLLDTYKTLPGFVPISKKQQIDYINNYIKFLRKDFTVIVTDKNNEPIAFGITMPSMTKAFKKANGKLFPFGILHILAARQWSKLADLALIGVKDGWKKKGAHSLVFAETIKALNAAGIFEIKVNPMLKKNQHVLALWKDFKPEVYKRRESYRKRL
ncbi:MAG TPA: hypothetical protein ENJ95_19015 [Bacteroidetes bacterium]|nr:hypothetical protein [Bacteroidota bacterium]